MFCNYKDETYIIGRQHVLVVGLFLSLILLILPQIIRISGIIGRIESTLQCHT
jgi:hypothetical protein